MNMWFIRIYLLFISILIFLSFLREKTIKRKNGRPKCGQKSIRDNNKKDPSGKQSEVPNKNDHENIKMEPTNNM